MVLARLEDVVLVALVVVVVAVLVVVTTAAAADDFTSGDRSGNKGSELIRPDRPPELPLPLPALPPLLPLLLGLVFPEPAEEFVFRLPFSDKDDDDGLPMLPSGSVLLPP